MLFNFEPPATPDEVHAAAVQYVRKVSGSTKVSDANRAAFLRAVDDIETATAQLLDSLVAHGPPRSREREAEKARARWAAREARIRAR
jgi:hypothetical protein